MRWVYLTFLIPLCAPIPALAEGHDYPGLGHIPGYHLTNYSERGFDSASLEADPGQKIPVEGHTISIMYYTDNHSNHASVQEVYLNYLAVLKPLKAEMLHTPANLNDGNEHLFARFYRNGAPVYVNITTDDDATKYFLLIIEQKEFKPSIITTPEK
jgi:hypothetical protein